MLVWAFLRRLFHMMMATKKATIVSIAIQARIQLRSVLSVVSVKFKPSLSVVVFAILTVVEPRMTRLPVSPGMRAATRIAYSPGGRLMVAECWLDVA